MVIGIIIGVVALIMGTSMSAASENKFLKD